MRRPKWVNPLVISEHLGSTRYYNPSKGEEKEKARNKAARRTVVTTTTSSSSKKKG